MTWTDPDRDDIAAFDPEDLIDWADVLRGER